MGTAAETLAGLAGLDAPGCTLVPDLASLSEQGTQDPHWEQSVA